MKLSDKKQNPDYYHHPKNHVLRKMNFLPQDLFQSQGLNYG
jgi:hypothetical protein